MPGAIRTCVGAWLRPALAALLTAAAALPARSAGIELGSDARVDLMGLVQHLSGDQSLAPPKGYAARALERFKPMTGHPAVRALAQMRASGFSSLVPAQYAAHLSDPPELRERVPTPDFFAERAGGREKMDSFLDKLRRFARDARFMEWRASEREAISAGVASVKATALTRRLQTALEGLLGGRLWSRWRGIVSAFYPRGSVAWVVEPDEGLPEVFIIAKSAWKGDAPVQRPPLHVASDLLNEAVYVAVYAVVEVCRPALPSPAEVCERGETDAEFCLGRHLTDALARRALERMTPGATHGTEDPRAVRLERALTRYERSRGAYPTIIDFAPELLGAVTGGPAPYCRLVDPDRFQSELYARRLDWYLDLRLRVAPTPELRAARDALRAHRRSLP